MKSRALWTKREKENNSEYNIAQSNVRICRNAVLFWPIPCSVLDQTFLSASVYRIYNTPCSIAMQ
jgi:hypothetical protein